MFILTFFSALSQLLLKLSANEKHESMLREYLNVRYVDGQVLVSAKEEFGSAFDGIKVQFGKIFGISVEEYVENRRMNAAKELLRFSVKPMEEVAAESGIGDYRTMQKMFEAKENMSAEEYRMKWSQWVK